MWAVRSGPKTVIAWSHQQFVRVICATGVVGRAIGGAVGWEWSQSCCWRWVRAAIHGTQAAEPLVGGVGARGGAIGAGVHPRLVARWGRSEPGEAGGVIGVVVLRSLRGAIGAVRSELKVARLEQSVVGWEPKAAVWLEPKWAVWLGPKTVIACLEPSAVRSE
jgi:hypothetical protein